MAIVGAFARIERERDSAIRTAVSAHPGVSTFTLPDPGMVGILLETADLDSAHALLTEDIRNTPGVLGVWPVYANTEDEELEENLSGRPTSSVAPVGSSQHHHRASMTEDRGTTRDRGIA